MLLEYVTSYGRQSSQTERLPITPSSLIARIGISNSASIELFQKLGFQRTKVVEVFSEVEMKWIDNKSNFVGGQRVDWP